MVVKLCFSSAKTASDPVNRQCLIIGKLENFKYLQFSDIKEKLIPRVSEESYEDALSQLSLYPSDTMYLWRNNALISVLPSTSSRHNCPAQPHVLAAVISNKVKIVEDGEACIVMVCEKKDAFASACAIARSFPQYSMKSSNNKSNVNMTVTVEFFFVGEEKGKSLTDEDAACMTVVAEGIRHSAKIVDMPCNEMHTDAFIQEIKQIQSQLDGVNLTVIQGEELRERGFGGIYGVGKAAVHAPALAILSHTPENAQKTIAWVGKGIVYDTGGLSIKGKTAMPGMKRDCGGAAGVLGAFYAAVKQGFKENLHALFCLAENSVGPIATRPDDIHTLYSGKTVEINNTDAEGRLVLSDGVAYALKDLHADIILDMATLTGAQGVATGKYHAALLTNDSFWEQAGVLAGKSCGDLLFPIPYTPELHFSEFNSAVADMKNSVASRENAQVSCAGLFIGAHIGFDYKGVWIHVDMASPAHMGERATGYGVALLVTLFGQASESTLLQELSPKIT